MAIKRILPDPPERVQLDISLFIINIVLLLILFFLATGQSLNSSAVQVPLAVTQDLPLDALPSPLLEVTSNGLLRLGGVDVIDGSLANVLSGQTTVYVLMAADAAAQDLVDVLARPELSGVDLQLVTIANTRSEP